ncbi:MAG: glycine cleavage system protein GcvH, partial [Deltaproteobacteria bacterium]|nr:glycine cleavage system protein GcvH [Deltaproteobacteria bacterium]
MKELNELILPDDVRFTEEHEWARKEGENVRVGISDYAQDQLGDIVFVELPEVGSSFSKGDEFGTVESVKTVSELYMPIGGEVVAINEELADHPEYVNTDPYGKGWM